MSRPLRIEYPDAWNSGDSLPRGGGVKSLFLTNKEFRGDGRTILITDAKGNTWTYTYDVTSGRTKLDVDTAWLQVKNEALFCPYIDVFGAKKRLL